MRLTFYLLLTGVAHSGMMMHAESRIEPGGSTPLVSYSFREFPYTETVSSEKTWSEYESACSQSPRCLQLTGLEHTNCGRECISPSCYLDIYKHDELEEGEIDVRLASFKGCFLQRVIKPNRS